MAAMSGRLAAQAPDRGPRFDAAVPPGGYAWWYVDALSDDGRHGLTIIAFIGSVFSPYYACARRRGDGRSATTIARSTSRSTASAATAGR